MILARKEIIFTREEVEELLPHINCDIATIISSTFIARIISLKIKNFPDIRIKYWQIENNISLYSDIFKLTLLVQLDFSRN